MAERDDETADKVSATRPQAQAPVLEYPKLPSFGQTSQLRSPLTSNNAFNVPKANRPRPEHHRVKEDRYRAPSGSDDDVFHDPIELMNQRLLSQAAAVPIRPPDVQHIRAIQRPAPTKYSSLQTSFSKYAADDGLKRDLQFQGMSKVDAALFEDKYASYETLDTIDPIKAAKDVKALLEGAFDDDEDGPRTRKHKKTLAEAVDALGEQLQSVKVENDMRSSIKPEYTRLESQDVDGPVDDGSRDGLKVKLLPHQIDGVDWMVRQEIGTKAKRAVTMGGILADDMGLGKTIQTIALLLLNPRSKPRDPKIAHGTSKTTLVVAPLALIKQWERELEDKVDDSHYLKVLIHHGPKRVKRGEDLRRYDVVITTYQTITSEFEASSAKDDGPKVGCFDLKWYRVILDEAHTIKNRNAKCTKGCYDLRAEYRWCLTGTPMQNSLEELHSLIVFLRVKSFSSRSVWKEKIVDPMSKGKIDLAIQRLQAILKTVLKRRTKDVLREQGSWRTGESSSDGFKLVGRKVEVVKAKFSAKELHFYQQLQQKADDNIERMMSADAMSFAGALALLLRLRQACNHKELIKKSLGSDPDALEVVGKSTRFKSPTKSSQVTPDDISDLTNLLGGLGVDDKRCELCGDELSREEKSSDMVRCVDCEAFVEDDEKDVGHKGMKSDMEKKHRKHARTSGRSRREKNRPILRDSDDEEDKEETEAADWVVPKLQRLPLVLGNAEGSDDEDAEGGGEWLESDDSDTDEEKYLSLPSRNKQTSSQPANNGSTPDYGYEDSMVVNGGGKKLGISTKIQAVLKILHKEISEHKFIIFSEWTSMLNLIEPFLRRENIRYCRYDGKMKNDAREASLDQLRNDKKTRVLLCSLKCGSLGLNLTAASRVILMEPFWNPFVEEQAIDRVHRLNQTVDVVVYRLTIEETVEQRIFDLQDQKRELASAALEGKAIAKLSMNELLNLFKHDAEHYVRGTKLGDFMLGNIPSSTSSRSGSSTPAASDSLGTRPRVQQKQKTSSRPEHQVYGRRW